MPHGPDVMAPTPSHTWENYARRAVRLHSSHREAVPGLRAGIRGDRR